MRILVTGSRDWRDRLAVYRAIVQYISENAAMSVDSQGLPVDYDTSDYVIVHGGCPTGADHWANEYGIANWIETEVHPAYWGQEGRIAGFKRNQRMVDLGADVCLAFLKMCSKPNCMVPYPHYSHGTVDCVKRAVTANIEVRRYYE